MSRVPVVLLCAGSLLVCLMVAPSLAAPLPQFSPDTWAPPSTGLWNDLLLVTSNVTHLITYDGDLFAGGSFTHAGLSGPHSGHAAWNGIEWGPFPDAGMALPFAEYQGDLFAGKYRWDGTSAVNVGGSYVPQVIYSDATQLISAGADAGYLVKVWNDQTSGWDSIPGIFQGTSQSPRFYAIHPWQNGWVVTGRSLDTVGGLPIQGAAYWDGAQWNDYGPIQGVEGYALTVYQGQLLMGTSAGLYRWNGSSWELWGGIPQFNDVYALTVDGTNLYVGGLFTQAGLAPASNIARFDGTSWHDLDGGVDGAVWTIVPDGNRIYVGGKFRVAGSRAVFSLAYWDGTSWNRTGSGGLGLGWSGAVHDWAAYGGSVIAAGDFPAWGGLPLHNVARLENDVWVPLGSGLNDEVRAVVPFQNDLIAVGPFTASGATPMVQVARFDGNNWNAMLSSTTGEVRTTAVVNDELHIGGSFWNLDGMTVANVARHDGNAWQPLGLGTTAGVETLVEFEGDLIAGGSFLYASGTFVSNTARWDGLQWSPMGLGLNSRVDELKVIDGTLYAVGQFTQSGTSPASHVARWDGSTWQPLAGGVNGAAHDIVKWGSLIYVVGDFTQADGLPAAGIAAWDPQVQTWLDLGYGLHDEPSPPVLPGPRSGTALLAVDATLYVSGDFGSVYEDASNFVLTSGVAILNDPTMVAAPSVPSERPLWLTAHPNPFNPHVVLRFELAAASRVELSIYDVRGRRVTTLRQGLRPAGVHRESWNGIDEAGKPVASGVYYARLRDDHGESVRKIVLSK